VDQILVDVCIYAPLDKIKKVTVNETSEPYNPAKSIFIPERLSERKSNAVALE